MDTRTDQPAPHAGEKEKGAGVEEAAAARPRRPRPAPVPADAAPPAEGPSADELEREGFPAKH